MARSITNTATNPRINKRLANLTTGSSCISIIEGLGVRLFHHAQIVLYSAIGQIGAGSQQIPLQLPIDLEMPYRKTSPIQLPEYASALRWRFRELGLRRRPKPADDLERQTGLEAWYARRGLSGQRCREFARVGWRCRVQVRWILSARVSIALGRPARHRVGGDGKPAGQSLHTPAWCQSP